MAILWFCESSENEIESLQSCLARVDSFVLIYNLKPGKHNMCCMFEIGMEFCTRFESAFDNRKTIMRHFVKTLCVAPLCSIIAFSF